MNKCHNCLVKPLNHKFKICLSETCQCPCVNQIYKMGENLQEDSLRIIHPKFLNITPVEVKKLPNQDLAIKEYNRIDKDEWLPKKKDKRFKRKR